MDYQLVLSDIDGTLVTDDFKLLPSTEKTVHDLVTTGVLFATVTARNRSYAQSAISGLSNVCCANAYLNGAYVLSPDGDVLLDRPIEHKDASVIIEQCFDKGASFCACSKNEVIAGIRHSQFNDAFLEYFGPYSEIAHVNTLELKPHFISAYSEDIRPVVEFVDKNLQTVDTGPIIRFQVQDLWVEESVLQLKGINKGAALTRIAEYFGIDVSKTIAIGDGIWNDGPMIEAAGWGVAMKNAHEEIIHMAQQVTEKDNNEDGVGDFLRKMFGL